MNRTTIAVVPLIVLAAACASSGGSGADASTTPGTASAGAAKADENRITAAEIEAAGLPNAYELVSRLRRPWLRGDPLTGGAVAVYMEERNMGGAEALRTIPAVAVAELRYLSNSEAVMRWGTAVQGSVIVVVPRR